MRNTWTSVTPRKNINTLIGHWSILQTSIKLGNAWQSFYWSSNMFWYWKCTSNSFYLKTLPCAPVLPTSKMSKLQGLHQNLCCSFFYQDITDSGSFMHQMSYFSHLTLQQLHPQISPVCWRNDVWFFQKTNFVLHFYFFLIPLNNTMLL